MQNIYQKFSYGLKWNALESIFYQLIFLTHHIFLFRAIPSDLYGLSGLLFSYIYLIISVIDLGLDVSLSSFFIDCTKSKKSFKLLFLPQLLPELILLILVSGALYCLPHIFPFSLSPFTLLLVNLLLILECLKKNLRTFLQIAFLNKTTSIAEILGLLFYVAIIWINIIGGYCITINTILFPMVLSSGFSTLFLAKNFYSLYRELPNNDDGFTISPKRILRNRLFNYGIQLNHILFSSNFLIPALSFQIGLTTAGILKLISTVTHSTTSIVRKTFSLPSDALFSHAKYLDMKINLQLFSTITHTLYQCIYGIIIFFSMNYKNILQINGISQTDNLWIIALLFLALQLSEYFFMPYEKFFIAQEKSRFLFLFNIISSVVLYICINSMPFSYISLLILLLSFRLLSLGLMITIAFYTWRLSFTLLPRATTLIYSLSIASIFFAILR